MLNIKKSYILDACALIAAIKQEEGAIAVANLYEDAIKGEIKLIINKVSYSRPPRNGCTR